MSGSRFLPLLFAVPLLLPQPAWAAAEGLVNSQTAMANLCGGKGNPLEGAIQPLQAQTRTYGEGLEIPASDLPSLQFEKCAEARSGSPAAARKDCDLTYAQILKNVRDGKISITKAMDNHCHEMKKDLDGCGAQNAAQNCAAGITRAASGKLNELAKLLKAKATELDMKYELERKNAKAELDRRKAAGNISDTTKPTAELREARLGKDVKRDLPACTRASGVPGPFCTHTAGAADAAYFSRRLKAAGRRYANEAADLAKLASASEGRSGQMGAPTDTSTDTAKSPMGMDDLLKLATVGMMGAGIYCSATGKCSKSKDNQSSITDPSATSGATSPTPVSNGATGPESSPLGANTAGSPGPAGSPAPPDTPATASNGSEGGGEGQGSFSLAPGENGLSHFNGALETRAPASTGASGGGFGSNGATPNPGGGPADGTRNPDYGGGAAIAGGGGFGNTGGFSLGDSHNASPTDAALKNILNGETPESETAAADNAAASGLGVQAGENESNLDDSSLFLRVKNTLVRCMRRACVNGVNRGGRI
jgi:hypothetical protein